MRAGLLALAAAASLALPASALAGPKLYECQHPTTTGQEAYHLVGVSPASACAAVRALAAFVHNGSEGYKLYRCAGRTATNPGHPVLVISRLDGWNLRVSDAYGLVMFRHKSSFAVTGTDFPLNCT